MSVYTSNDFVLDIALRSVLWIMFICLDFIAPFKRIILPEEIWLYKYPTLPSYVSSTNLWIIVLTIPSVVILRDYIRTKNKVELYNTVLSITLNYGLIGVFTQFLKVIVGRPRPNFFYKCFPDGEGGDFKQCTSEDARKSFPSGHSSFAFGSMFFLSLYLAGKLRVFVDGGRGSAWRLCLCILPITIALSIAVSRTCDYHHHYEDVIAGSGLGILIAYISYRQYFPSIYSPGCHFSYASQNLGMDAEFCT
ncbi:hypothetical protein FQA39_LY08758 [Lamprigera yunnana]|nr:hypothetical protein FQA39_LY08758 [Lamprigera yunnana]